MNLKLDADFTSSRKVLASRRKQPTQFIGTGNKPNATRPLEGVEVDKLYKSGYFGTRFPLVLQWWIITNLFVHRGQDEARKLKFWQHQII